MYNSSNWSVNRWKNFNIEIRNENEKRVKQFKMKLGLVRGLVVPFTRTSHRHTIVLTCTLYGYNFMHFWGKDHITRLIPLPCQGVLLSVPETMEEVNCMKTLWVHEVARVFCDRLVDSTDRQWLLGKVEGACTKHLNQDYHELLNHLDQDGDGKVSLNSIWLKCKA